MSYVENETVYQFHFAKESAKECVISIISPDKGDDYKDKKAIKIFNEVGMPLMATIFIGDSTNPFEIDYHPDFFIEKYGKEFDKYWLTVSWEGTDVPVQKKHIKHVIVKLGSLKKKISGNQIRRIIKGVEMLNSLKSLGKSKKDENRSKKSNPDSQEDTQ